VNPSLLQRQAALAGVALAAGVGAIAFGRDTAPASAPVKPVVQWHDARVGVAESTAASGCASPIDERIAGVVHPVLPCGAKLVVEGNGRTVRAEVVGHRAVAPSVAFDLTRALAQRLGVQGETVIRWRFAT